MTELSLGVLREINVEVNRSTDYWSDISLYGKTELWTEAIDKGDCEDYALAKRRRLLDLGWPIQSLRLAVCMTVEQEAHAVLTVDWLGETWVLDNNTDDVLRWRETSYRWICRQKAGENKWVKILE